MVELDYSEVGCLCILRDLSAFGCIYLHVIIFCSIVCCRSREVTNCIQCIFYFFLQLLKNHVVYLITKHAFASGFFVFLQLCSVVLALAAIDGDPVCQTH